MNIYSVKVSPNRPFNNSELTYLLERCAILSKKAKALDYIKECHYRYDSETETFKFDFVCIHDKHFSFSIVKDDRLDDYIFSMQKYEKWSVLKKEFLKSLAVIHQLHTEAHS
ncbi:hypothetical protein ACYSNR_03525 [Enterococcus sp. LJL128]|uniref:hypothetical protein n=1 Tax=Enterococcus sp. LJL51 TaxID=3416656 RepID=UPI003CF03FDD